MVCPRLWKVSIVLLNVDILPKPPARHTPSLLPFDAWKLVFLFGSCVLSHVHEVWQVHWLSAVLVYFVQQYNIPWVPWYLLSVYVHIKPLFLYTRWHPTYPMSVLIFQFFAAERFKLQQYKILVPWYLVCCLFHINPLFLYTRWRPAYPVFVLMFQVFAVEWFMLCGHARTRQRWYIIYRVWNKEIRQRIAMLLIACRVRQTQHAQASKPETRYIPVHCRGEKHRKKRREEKERNKITKRTKAKNQNRTRTKNKNKEPEQNKNTQNEKHTVLQYFEQEAGWIRRQGGIGRKGTSLSVFVCPPYIYFLVKIFRALFFTLFGVMLTLSSRGTLKLRNWEFA